MTHSVYNSLTTTATSFISPTLVLIGFVSVLPILYIANLYCRYKRYQTATPWSARDKVVVITGASSGIGEELAYEFARQGAILILCARRTDKLADVEKACREKYGASQVTIHKVDVTRDSDVDRLIETIDATHEKIDCLVLNAGVSMGEALEDVEDFNIIKNIMDVNFYGSAMLTYHALPLLKKAEKSRITVISSLASVMPFIPMRTGYAASKCALRGFFDSLQTELLKDNIFITIAYPGIVKTEINNNRLGKNPKNLDFSKAMPADECAKVIVDGTIKAHKEIVFTNLGKLARVLDGTFPDLLFHISQNYITKQISVEKKFE
ncbi:hypothetical protein RclHR1_00020022 [Rhizophagus clarus]|uniref:SDR family oxidoreductase n=1 Tax=Rhizophagus clarus TaxID=94130 RepID=A0A2Z6R2S9_9GLOM|nr:hypothetical protein RclHR1_00020022 [Rhizophagus clarus]GES80148.1 SDR family oxidoreductase [Rhizophagus clarus]